MKSAEASKSEQQSRGRTLVSLVSPPDLRPPRPNTSHARSISPSGQRRFSLIEEEQLLEEEEEEEEGGGGARADVVRKVRLATVGDDSLSDDSDSRGSYDRMGSPSHRKVGNGHRKPQMRPLHSVRSSPQLLNQIFEEGEGEEQSDNDDMLPNWISPPHLLQQIPMMSPQTLHKVDRAPRRRITALSAHSRGSSYSSSDTSDNDELDISRKCSKDKLKHRFRRRDSSDHSSDTDGPSTGTSFKGTGKGLGHQRSVERRSNGGGGSTQSGAGRHSQKSRDKSTTSSGGSKRNGAVMASIGTSNTLSDAPAGGSNEQKFSNASLASNLSNLSTNSGIATKYRTSVSAGNSPNTSRHALKDVEALNIENKSRSRIIHVRSKDFTDLVARFKGKDADAAFLKEPGTKFRRRPKQKLKTDINKNGLVVAHADCSLSDSENTNQQNVAKTKCCSVI